MSIAVDKLSLLGALAPLRQGAVNDRQPENGFADKLDRALDNGVPPVSSVGSRARELAESLTMQMLQSSLDLAGDSSGENTGSASTVAHASTNALLQAYRANLATGEESLSPASASVPLPPSQLQDFADGESADASNAMPSQSSSSTAWLDPLVARASRKYGVDVGLIKAVIKAESDFNPQAVSHAGARGLMQLMPATARSLGVSDSFDPEQNVMAGTRFLKDMLQRYNGNVDSALAAYNWGPGNVDRHPANLPRETRDYLARVKQLYTLYSS